MFEVFDLLGMAHPKFTNVGLFPPGQLVVVYVDQYAHQGEGKLLITAGDACRLYVEAAHAALERGKTRLTTPEVDALIDEFRPHGAGSPERGRTLTGFNATEYIGDYPGVTYRLLSCGGYSCWFRHDSFDDWRSNAGDGDLLEILDGEISLPTGFEKFVVNPVWAIDFVAQKSEVGPPVLLAIDFNTAPRVAGTPLAKRVKPQELASAIRMSLEAATRLMSSSSMGHNGRRKIIDNNLINLIDVE
jgi:hypothetical protein